MAKANEETKTTWESAQVLPFLRSSGKGNIWLKTGIPRVPVSSEIMPAVADSIFQDAG